MDQPSQGNDGTPAPMKVRYYTTKGRRIGDFLIGFFGLSLAFASLSFVAGFVPEPAILPVMAIEALAVIACLIYFALKGRAYITIGAITLILAPLIIVGGCMMIFGVGMH